MTYQHIVYDEKDGVGTITFNRPQALNALNGELLKELAAALDAVANSDTVRVLVLTGAGDKAFVAGADITEIATCTPLTGRVFARNGQKVIDQLQDLPIPVIAAVNGYALGGGTEMALACDFVYAADSATFGLPEITLGIIPGFGGTQRLPRLIGISQAKEMIFTGRMVSADEANALGIVNRVVPASDLMDTVYQTAALIAAKGRVSLRAAKEAINAGLNMDLADGCRFEADAFAICLASEDAAEGTSAFLEKRKAVFAGDLSK